MIYRTSSAQFYWIDDKLFLASSKLILKKCVESLEWAGLWLWLALFSYIALQCKATNECCIQGFSHLHSLLTSSLKMRLLGFHDLDNGFLPLMSVASETFIISSCHRQTSERAVFIY